MAVRVRFAPSPTGYLHVGGARTALFNWLFARHFGGTFILRIEDTDQQRSTEESVQAILDGMNWLGLDWDEGPGVGGPYGPYFQTERLAQYQAYAERLMKAGRAYKCYCSPEELEARRQALLAAGQAPKYDRACLGLSEEECRRREAEGRKPVIRFRALDDGQTVINDLIRGRIVIDNSTLDDFVLMKSDGMPTYNFAAVIDDAAMEITHVIRGDDHISNTPRQIQVYEALGLPLPQFAHVPMILGPDKTRLSKRHGATAVGQYKEQGYLPEAMVNYLALLGWSLNATETLFSREQLVKYFTLERCSKNPAVFDLKKLEWMNGVYIRQTPTDKLAELVLPFLTAEGVVTEKQAVEPGFREYLRKVAELQQTRLKRLDEFVSASRYFFADPELGEGLADAVREQLAKPYVAAALTHLSAKLEALPEFGHAEVEQAFGETMADLGLGTGELIHPVRAALTGQKVSPGIYDVVLVLGRETVLRRLGKALAWVERQIG
ncbi:MAG: glutamate--tRNA ligase [Chitinophagales bacterium]